MHSDIHLHLHRLRAAELRHEARTAARPDRRPHAARPRPHAPLLALRHRLGWALVEAGLRLVQPAGRRIARRALP
ncbi:hypothetical protein [Streptomyces lycii]|uniref:Uncharacterized protein n=1 Tax=Streptomyces lycii TaxID=2654337 RepID=A0ABQ7FJ38_9ACTN|nr:hypothetical protein [Streptomyces lycii]KAF4408825.1 hypothetical protein GCU69_12315 [Streptomyces lycii]